MADWEEVKRLAADFQKIQLSSTSQRLSERNCIEIVTWLMQRKMVDLIFTTDGKEYLTPSQLVQDIRGELYVNSGRVNLVELAKSIGVDLNHITGHLNEVLKGHKDIHSVLGQLIDKTYITKLAGEINEKLQQQGQINVNELTIQYDLPADFLHSQIIEKYLGKLIFGKQDKNDPRLFFTESFIARSKAKIKGALIGLTKPTAVSIILSNIDISEKFFFSLCDQSIMFGTLTSKTAGAQYIPNIYSRSQNEWVNNFYKQNGYIEFDALVRLGISDYKTYLKKQFPNENLTYLNSCVISKRILDQAEADIDECVISRSYLDLQSNLPSVFNEKDINAILDIILNGHKSKETVLLENYVFSKFFVDGLINDCEGLVQEKAKIVVESGKFQQHQTELLISSSNKNVKQEYVEESKIDKREERRKKASGGKSGGGTQGRETKTKSTKKSRNSTKTIDFDEDFVPTEKKNVLAVVTADDVKGVILNKIEEEGLDELLETIIVYLLPTLNEKGIQTAGKLYAATVTDRTASRRQTHNEVQNKLNVLLGDVRLFEKGIKLFSGDTQTQLYKYLLKSLCTDIMNEILNYIAAEQGLSTNVDNYTNEQKTKFINDLPLEYKTSLVALSKTLTGQTVEEFMKATEEALTSCSMIIKKIDKKKDRVIVLNRKHSLMEELNKCDEPALVLHLATLIIFISATQSMLHASGRHVAAVLLFLKDYLNPEQASELFAYHDLVSQVLSNGTEAENAKELLKEKLTRIKDIANEYKKLIPEKS